MKFDKKIVFQGIKSKIDKSLNQDQVDGIDFLLDSFEKYSEYWDDVRQIAYAFATIYHETAMSFQPVAEGYYLGDPNKPDFYRGNTDRVFRFQKSLRYYPDFGRGYVQLTWAENYIDQNTKIKQFLPEIVDDFEEETGEKFNLVKYPEQLFNPKISFAVMTIGMHFGTFRPGHTLDRYFTKTKTDWIWARYIINGKKKGETYPDHAEAIAETAKKFNTILQLATVKNSIISEKDQEVDNTPITDDETKNDNTLVTGENPGVVIVNNKTPEGGEQTTNIDNSTNSVPDNFVPENKTIEAPPSSKMLSKAWKWLLGLGLIPTTGSGIIEAIKNANANGTMGLTDVLNVVKEVFLFLLPYLFWIAIAFIVFWGIKELLKQISFIVTQYTMARSDMHNVTVVPNENIDNKTISITGK